LKRNLARLVLAGLPNRPGVAGGIFARVAGKEIMVDDIVQLIHADGRADISFTIDGTDLDAARSLGTELTKEHTGARIEIKEQLAKVSVVGVGMRTHTGVAARMFEALAAAQVNIENISTSEIVISCVVRHEDGERALRAVHTAFGLDASGGGLRASA